MILRLNVFLKCNNIKYSHHWASQFDNSPFELSLLDKELIYVVGSVCVCVCVYVCMYVCMYSSFFTMNSWDYMTVILGKSRS
jgi:hypothetical protein